MYVRKRIAVCTYAAFFYHNVSFLISNAHTGAHLNTVLQICLLMVCFLFKFFPDESQGSELLCSYVIYGMWI